VNESAASENVNLFKWYGVKTYTGKHLCKYMQMLQYSQYGPIFACLYEVTGQKNVNFVIRMEWLG